MRVSGIIALILGLLATAFAHGATANSAYVANRDNNNVSVIDLSTRTVVDTVSVGTDPTGVAITPDGSRVYVVNSGSNAVSVIDTATLVVTDTILVGLNPSDISISPD